MNKNRILTKGTDVRLRFKLGELNKFDVTSVKQMRCYLVRHEDKDFAEKIHHCNFPQFYHPTEYTMNHNIYCNQMFTYYNPYFSSNAMFGKVSDYFVFPSYNGFGVYTKKFVNTHTDYLCASRLLPEKNMAECYFPAEDQRFIGTFDLIVMVTLYQRGWGDDNLRTYTVRRDEAFELIEGPSTASGDIDLDKEEPKVVSIEFSRPYYSFEHTDVICFGQSDISNNRLGLKLIYSDGSVKMYDGEDDIDIQCSNEYITYDKLNMCFRLSNEVEDNVSVAIDATYGDLRAMCGIGMFPKLEVIFKGEDYHFTKKSQLQYDKPFTFEVSSEVHNHFPIVVTFNDKDLTTSTTFLWDNTGSIAQGTVQLNTSPTGDGKLIIKAGT